MKKRKLKGQRIMCVTRIFVEINVWLRNIISRARKIHPSVAARSFRHINF
jgi:hypothetical protein